MKITFIKYDANKRKLQFRITKELSEINNEYALSKKLFTQVNQQLGARIYISSNNLYTIDHFETNSFVELFLMQTKKCFITNGIDNTSWEIFVKQISLECKIQISEKKKVLADLPDAILQDIAHRYIGTYSRPAMLNINKAIYKQSSTSANLLRIHYPKDYKKIQTDKTPNFDCKEAFKWLHINYVKDLKHFSLTSRFSFTRNLKLLILFKEGDFTEIQKAKVTLAELWLIRDYYHKTWNSLLSWAHQNNHQYILNYFYNDFLSEVRNFGMTELHWAIFCFQDLDVIKALSGDKTNINLPLVCPEFNQVWSTPYLGTKYTPIELAAFCGHTPAIKYLYKLVDLTARTPLFETSHLTLLHLAAMNNHLESVKFLCENGADISACANFYHQGKPINLAPQQVAMYMITLPEVIFDLLHRDKIAEPYLFYKRYDDEKSLPFLIKSQIHHWMIQTAGNKHNILFPLINYLKKQKIHPNTNDNLRLDECLVMYMLITHCNDDLQTLNRLITYAQKEYLDKDFLLVLDQIKTNLSKNCIEKSEPFYKKLKF